MPKNIKQIKVRGWHVSRKRMFSAETMGRDQLTLSVDGRGFVNVSGRSTTESEFYGEEFIPLLYTNHNDMDEVEIYEGDIFGSISQLRCVVKRREDGAFILKFLDDRIASWVITDPRVKNSKVVGNIYENPELLEENNA